VTKGDEYRVRADQCDLRAKLAQSEAVRHDYQDMARQWRYMAGQADQIDRERRL
jgi:hypothetical protein